MAVWYSETATANTQYPDSSGLSWDGGLVDFSASGTFGSATVKLQASHDGGSTWYDIDTTDAQFTADGSSIVRQGSGKSLRIDVSGGSGHSIDLYLDPVPE